MISRLIRIVPFLALVLVEHSASAEVIGALLPRGTFELGIQQRWMDRTQATDERTVEWSQNDMSVVARWGATNFATVSLEGMTGSGPWLSNHEDTQQFYLVGGAFQATMWRGPRLIVTGSFGFNESVQRFEEENDRTFLVSSVSLEALAQTNIPIKSQLIVIWGGPIISNENVDYPKTPTRLRQEYNSDSNFGGVAGLNLILFDHVNVSGQLVWVENPEPRFSLLYRF